MSNVLLRPAAGKLWTADLDGNAESIDWRIALVSSGHTANDDTDEFLDDLGANVLALSDTLTNVTFTGGIFTSDPAEFAGGSITTGTATNAYVVRYGPGSSDDARELVIRIGDRAGGGALSWSVQSGVDATLTPDGTTGWCDLSNAA